MKLTERRKSDRDRMAAEVIAFAQKHGFTATLRDPEYCGPRETTVEIVTTHGLCLNLGFDGESCQPDTYVLSWHFNCREHPKLSPGYWRSVNTCHYHKATTIAHGWEQLICCLRDDFDAILTGEAFQQPGSEIPSLTFATRLLPA